MAKKRGRAAESSSSESDSDSDSHHSKSGSDTPTDDGRSSPEIGPDATQEALYRALRKQQSLVNEVRGESKRMRRKLADVTNSTKPPKKGHKRQKRDHNTAASDCELEDIRVLGRKFAVTNMLWLRDKKKAFTTPVDDAYNPRERFETKSSKVQGQLADLRDILPEALQKKMKCMEKNGLADAFRAGMSDQRSTMSHRIRRAAGPDIFGCTSQQLLTSASRAENFHKRIGWVPDPENATGGKYDPWIVEILHKDYEGKFDRDTVFLSPTLQYIFAAIERGPSAVALLQAGKEPVVQAETNDQIWGSVQTTPGDITGSAVLTYLEYLTTGLEKRKASVINIFRVWDAIFYPNSMASGSADDGKSTAAAMDALNADEEVVESEEE
ncbi:hypothetical protein B0H16DRAFT_1463279 [Mycena metata]|uniref:Uncharacterized protein n=1 Tax=Mycena metata TaxID=1033252 RepID=A0AAD7IKQ6_9AGAR|nr:hypothetical protein B0H16DRAFT_1463279 [Mycena metata]